MNNWNPLLVALAFGKADAVKYLIHQGGMYVNLYGVDPDWDGKQETKNWAETFCLRIAM